MKFCGIVRENSPNLLKLCTVELMPLVLPRVNLKRSDVSLVHPKWIFSKDPGRNLQENGNPPRLLPENGNPPRYLPENGNPPRYLPENGNPPRYLPENGNPPRIFPEKVNPPKTLPETGNLAAC